MSDYWFARRFPVGHRRNAMAPVTREGWLVMGGFVAAMIVGAVIGILLLQSGNPIVVFGVVAGVAAWIVISVAMRKGDYQRSVADYRRPARGGLM